MGGGTALCLRLAHRCSDDLDLFRSDAFEPLELLRELEAAGLKALTYIDDAELEPEPRLLRQVEWCEIKRYFEDEVRRRWAAFET